MESYDWRMFKREQYDGTVDVTVSVIRSNAIEKRSFAARTVDISQGGIGIVSDVPLEPGFVRLTTVHENRAGIVMWNRKLDDNTYRVGIRFDPLFSMNQKSSDEVSGTG